MINITNLFCFDNIYIKIILPIICAIQENNINRVNGIGGLKVWFCGGNKTEYISAECEYNGEPAYIYIPIYEKAYYLMAIYSKADLENSECNSMIGSKYFKSIKPLMFVHNSGIIGYSEDTEEDLKTEATRMITSTEYCAECGRLRETLVNLMRKAAKETSPVPLV